MYETVTTSSRTLEREVTQRGALDELRRVAVEYDLARAGLVFTLHWLFVTLMAALATRYAAAMPTVDAVGYRLPQLHGWRELVIQPLRNWDGAWYSLIAEYGYRVHPATTAFWPLYPWSMQVLSDTFYIRIETAGLLLANAAFFGALTALYRLAKLEWGVDVARRALWLVAFFPTAFFFSAVYSESFFLLFSVLAFYWARTGKWWQAGLAGFLAALTRNVGVLLVLPLALMFVRQRGWRYQSWWPTGVALTLPLAGAGTFLLYLRHAYGNAFITIDAQQGWARIRAYPWTTFRMAFEQLDLGWLRVLLQSPGWATLTSRPVRFAFGEYESLDVAVTLLAIPLLGYCLAKLRPEYSVFAVIVFALPLFSPSTIHPLMSMPRFVLVLFPLFIGMAQLLRRPWLFGAWMTFSVIMLALLTIQFSTWFWVA
jgi:hypothetical protein